MILPHVENASAFQGLYVFDFGEWAAVGYSAEEIAMLLEEPRYAEGKVYRIHRALPDGTMELHAMSRERFSVESGMFFLRSTVDEAQGDFDALCRLAEQTPPPCRAAVRLIERGGDAAERGGYLVALLYPAEYDAEMSGWLLDVDYAGGDTVEGGISAVTALLEDEHSILERRQLWSATSVSSRSREQVLADVRRAVQR